MAQIQGKWIKNDAIKENHILTSNDAALRFRNALDTANVSWGKGNASDLFEFLVQPQFIGVPSNDQDLVNKGYVLDVLAGIRDPKDACRVASVGNVDIATGGLLSIDGIGPLAAGDRVLLKNQTDAKQNGIYVVAAGAWSRSTDADTNAEFTQGLSTMIVEGTNNARKLYVCTTQSPDLGVTDIAFVQAPNPANFLVPQEMAVNVNATIVANGYFDLAHKAEDQSVVVIPIGGPLQIPTVDYTVSEVGGVTRVTFAGDLAAIVADGDVLSVKYSYATA